MPDFINWVFFSNFSMKYLNELFLLVAKSKSNDLEISFIKSMRESIRLYINISLYNEFTGKSFLNAH